MADNYTQRPNRQSDPYARPDASAAAGSGNDPLAELARLIGQTDPFGEFGRDARRAQAAPQPQPGSAPQQAARRPAPAASEWGDAPLGVPAMPQHAQDPRRPGASANYAASQPAYAPAAQPAAYAPAAPPQPHAPAQAYGFDADGAAQAQPGQANAYPADAYQAYDAAAYGQQQAGPDAAYETDAYYQAGHVAPEADDIYDDAPPPQRRRIVLIASVAALVVLGVAGAWGYRSMFGPSGSSAPPPVIKADTTPSKIVPPPNGDSGNGKQIYDRIGDRSQGEKLVSREEQPVEVKPAPRVVFPGPSQAQPAAQPAPSAPAVAAAPPAGIAALASTEPKKIRTIAIRPDQAALDSAVAAPVRPPAGPATTRTAAAPPAAASDAAPNPPAPPPAGRPAPAHQPPVQQAQAEAPGNAPLSLSPGAKTRAPAPTRVASAPPAAAAPAAPAASSGGPGSYVQVSSQRSEAEAQSAYHALAAKYPNVLGNRPVVVRRAEIPGKGTYYRATVGPFASTEQANELCSSLKAAGGACIVQRN